MTNPNADCQPTFDDEGEYEAEGRPHDWRIHPTFRYDGGTLMLICTKCGSSNIGPTPNPDDPSTWPRYVHP